MRTKAQQENLSIAAKTDTKEEEKGKQNVMAQM
jgi:hypothetical protein